MTRFFKTAFDYMAGNKVEDVKEVLRPQPKRAQRKQYDGLPSTLTHEIAKEPADKRANIRALTHMHMDATKGQIQPRIKPYLFRSMSEGDLDAFNRIIPVRGAIEKYALGYDWATTIDAPHLASENTTGLTVAWINNFKPTNTYKTSITMTNNPFFKWDAYDKKVLYNI